MISLDEKQLKSLHTRANLRRFLDYVQNGHVEKITKMCTKGLDPNFHCQDSGGKQFIFIVSSRIINIYCITYNMHICGKMLIKYNSFFHTFEI